MKGKFHRGLFWLILIAFILGGSIYGIHQIYLKYAEDLPPEIEFVSLPSALGNVSKEIIIKATDTGAGVDEVIIRAEQTGLKKDLFKKLYKEESSSVDVSIQVDAKALGFREGRVEFEAVTYDKSFWNNGARKKFFLNVDYRKPSLEVLSAQHNAVRGGVELAFYLADPEGVSESGVRVGEYRFPGFQAKRLNLAFKSDPKLHFAFFAVPLEFDESKDKVEAYAEDAAGNITTESFYYKVGGLRIGRKRVELKSDVSEKIKNLIASPEKSKAYFKRSRHEKFWEGSFLRQEGRVFAEYATELEIFTSGTSIGNIVELGTRYHSSVNQVVRAAQTGIVSSVTELGQFGKTIVIDHGFGLITAYANIGESKSREGDRVARGDVIGIVGQSGLAFATGVDFQVRLHGYPVRPVEWWDENWINDHINKKVDSFVKKYSENISD